MPAQSRQGFRTSIAYNPLLAFCAVMVETTLLRILLNGSNFGVPIEPRLHYVSLPLA